MKIAISAQGMNLSAKVDPRFGRCQYFIIVDTQTMQFEAIENSNIMAGGGAGIATAQMMADKGAQVVLTGNCGPNAYETLSAAGIQVITGVSGTVQDAVDRYKEGQFKSATQSNVDSHFGMGSSGTGMGPAGMETGTGPSMRSSMGPGMGMGRGMGRGMGKGMGMGRPGPGAGWSPMSIGGPFSDNMNLDQKLGVLKSQAQLLRQQVDDIVSQIDELENKSG